MKKPIRVLNLKKFENSHEISKKIDKYDDLIYELYQVRNPLKKVKSKNDPKFKQFIKNLPNNKKQTKPGTWFYFPWNKTLVSYLPEDLHQELRTARNKEVVSSIAQDKLYNATIAIAGLSVGSHAAMVLSMSGIAKHLKIADGDKISGTNLNRLHFDFLDIGQNKAERTAEYIYQNNPYADIKIFRQGVTEKNIDNFLSAVDILIDEMDNLMMKVRIRQKARQKKIPVLMATDNGNGIILDIERYDRDPKYPIFHGRVSLPKNIGLALLRHKDPKAWSKLSSKIIGTEFMEEDLQKSLIAIGQTINHVPQLGIAAVMSGSILAMTVKMILTTDHLKSGKYVFSPISTLDSDFQKKDAIKQRQKTLKQLNNLLDI
ncbi:MAG: ThiF family adenylyltransferase [Candidatus Paceibacterota bacterium]